MNVNSTASNSEYELMRQEIFRIGAKLDAMPQVYVTRNEYSPWVLSVEKRFDDVGRQFDEIDKLKTEGAKWSMEERQRIHNQIQETERHLQANQEKLSTQVGEMHNKLMEKIEEKLEKQDNKHDSAQNATWSWRQTWFVFGISTIIGVAEFIIGNLLSHH